MDANIEKKGSNKSVRQVDDAIRAEWKESFHSGDINPMRISTGYSEKILREALNHGLASPNVEAAITKFFNSKKVS